MKKNNMVQCQNNWQALIDVAARHIEAKNRMNEIPTSGFLTFPAIARQRKRHHAKYVLNDLNIVFYQEEKQRIYPKKCSLLCALKNQLHENTGSILLEYIVITLVTAAALAGTAGILDKFDANPMAAHIKNIMMVIIQPTP